MATLLDSVQAPTPQGGTLLEEMVVADDAPVILFIFEVDQAEHEYAGGAVGVVAHSVDHARTFLDVQTSDGEPAVMTLVLSLSVYNLNVGVVFENVFFS